MDISSVLGIIAGFGALMAGFLIEGGSMGMLNPLKHPSPFIIIFGGTFGCVVLSFPLQELKEVPKILKYVFTQKKVDHAGLVAELAELSDKARKEGLLSLEETAQKHENQFIRKGLSLIVDGIDPETIKAILARQAELYEHTYETAAKIFEAAGGFAPTMGVAGTVLGMIVILADMSDPGELGAKISVAFIATLLGVGFANLAFLPIAGKIKAKASQEVLFIDLTIEGLLSIHSGESPRILKEKLSNLMDEKKEKGEDSDNKETEG